MTPIEKQILENQQHFFSVLTAIYTKVVQEKDESLIKSLDKSYWKTINLLDEEEKQKKEEPCYEMPKKEEKFAISKLDEVKNEKS